MAKDHWAEYREQVVSEIARAKEDLAPLEEGRASMASREGNGPWVDETPKWIAQHKRTIATYETILKAIDNRTAP